MAAAQARLTVRFAAEQRAEQQAAQLAEQQAAQQPGQRPARDVGRSIAAQVALARRDSPAKGSRHVGLAAALVHELPHTMAALSAGRISE